MSTIDRQRIEAVRKLEDTGDKFAVGTDEQSIRALVGGLAPAPPPIGSNVATVERHAVELIRGGKG